MAESDTGRRKSGKPSRHDDRDNVDFSQTLPAVDTTCWLLFDDWAVSISMQIAAVRGAAAGK
jgi:hypothetical protein